ncbi:MAG: hypothetical protein M1449_12160 [Candidatus Thermoplasmatota archaeon]|nr:hypothetical protein [Candidatus Thermoplasmatota archaeon]
MQQQLDVFVASLTSFWTQLAGFVPQLLAALLLLFVGWLLANLVRTGVMKLLDLLRFDSLAAQKHVAAGSAHCTATRNSCSRRRA